MDSKIAAREATTEPSMLETPTASEPSHAPEAGEARAAPKERRRRRWIEPIREIPPRELCGKWVAWSGRHIVASGDTLAEVMQQVESAKIKDPSYELLPSLTRSIPG